MANVEKEICPSCDAKLKFIEDPEPMAYGIPGSLTVTVPLASSVYECPNHGLLRFYISGAVESVIRNE